jgi:N-acetylglucosaminyl-diphospho-decaprenol L-rhamnosyltransferase
VNKKLTREFTPKLVIVIVSYDNPTDVDRCLRSLARSAWTDFEIFVCENAGQQAMVRLLAFLTGLDGPLEKADGILGALDEPKGRLTRVVRCRFRGGATVVRLAAGISNLGYAGGVNAWLERLTLIAGWEAALVLNPDTVVESNCLKELLAKASEGFGMVGGTLVFDDTPDRISNYGLHWSCWTGRTIAVGRDSRAGSVPPNALLAKIDAISGACMLVTRAFVNQVGLMTEDYFLYMEDLDWGRRRGSHKIGFAVTAVVRHAGGTSIGSATDPKARSPLAVYLAARNSILFSRRWAGWLWPLHFAVGILYVFRYLLCGPPRIAGVALSGMIDGAKGKTGQPDMSRYHSAQRQVYPQS